MPMLNVKGYLAAVALFMVCCWANPNDAVPYRTRPRAEVLQIDQRVDNSAEASGVNPIHRGIGQPDLRADKKPALSGGGRNFGSSQRPRIPRSRIKNVNTNVNVRRNGRIDKSTTRLPEINHAAGRANRLPKIDQSTSLTKLLHKVDHFTEYASQLFKTHHSTESASQLSNTDHSTESTSRRSEIDDSTGSISRRPDVDDSTEYISTTRLPEIDHSTDSTSPTGLSEIDHTTKLISQFSAVDRVTNSLSEKNQFLVRSKTKNMSSITADHDISNTNMEPLTTETMNCSESHNENDRYSSSFSSNLTVKSLNVSDNFKVAGDAGTRRTSSVHVGEDITLCWIETTTIKEDRSSHPVQRLVIREYTISLENSATIPQRYLECVQLEGEVNGENNGVPKSALFEVIDENTQHSRIVNFTTISSTENLIVWQHRRVRCGVGPVVTKNIIEWADDSSNNPKKRVEIKVSPRLHRLSAQPTEVELYTTDFVGPQLTSTTPAIPSSSSSSASSSSMDCGPGTTCGSYSDCVDEWCGNSTDPNVSSTHLMREEQTTESLVTTSASATDENVNGSTTSNNDYESTELLSTPAESSSISSIELMNKSNTDVEVGSHEVTIPTISEELNLSTSEINESCESADSCIDYESSPGSEQDLSDNEEETANTTSREDGETTSTEGLTITPTASASFPQIMQPTTEDEGEPEYLSSEEWDTPTEPTERVDIINTEPSESVTPTTEFGTTKVFTLETNSMRAHTENEALTTVFNTEISMQKETTTQELSSTLCESSENCDTSFEDENLDRVHVPDESLVKKCDDGNETLSCKPVSTTSERNTEPIETITADETERTTIMTTQKEPPTSSGGTTNGAITSIVDMRTNETTTGIGNVTTELMTLSTTLGDETTTRETIIRDETIVQEITTDYITAITGMTTSLSTLGVEITTVGTTTAIGQTKTMLSTISGETTTGMSPITTALEEAPTISATTFGGKMTNEETATAIGQTKTMLTTISGETTSGMNDITTELEESSTTEREQSMITATEVSDASNETTSHATDAGGEGRTGTVLLTILEKSHLDVTDHGELNTDGVTETVYSTTELTEEMFTHNIDEGSNATTAESVIASGNDDATTVFSITSTTQTEITATLAGCDVSTGECDGTQTVAVTPVTLYPCDPESEDCDSKNDNTTSFCNEDSDDCSGDSSPISTTSCNEESGDCSIVSASISTTNCDDESGDCTSDSSALSETECAKDSSTSCTTNSEIERYSTSPDSSELCDNDATGNCKERTKPQDPIELLPTTTSTPSEIENVSTTVDDVPTTVESRGSTTVTVVSHEQTSNHKLALKIKILLEHIDEDKNGQKISEVEKHLLFNENPDEHGQHSLMKQVRSLNNTVSMETVQALFNRSAVEKLTGDVADYAAKHFAIMHDGIQNVDGLRNSPNSSEDLHTPVQRDLTSSAKPDFDPNVEMSLPEIHTDIHSGLTHVMTRVPPGHWVERRSPRASEKEIPHSRILEMVADPRDKRVHTRRKRQTIEDLTIDQVDLPKDIKEAGHWSNERVRIVVNGGHVRTLTEFTIYRSP